MKILLMLTIMYHSQHTDIHLAFRQPTFLAPEISYFNYEPGSTKVVDSSSPRTFEQGFDQPPTGLLREAQRRSLPAEAGDRGELVLSLLLLRQQDLPGLGLADISGTED